ncbi:MAG: arylamine N-acetyltransferase [Dongiaceae bacterium]
MAPDDTEARGNPDTSGGSESSDRGESSASQIDLDAYFARIGYDGPREATPETLRLLHLLHPQAMAFENLDPLQHRPVPIDLASLQQKLIRDGRGGYCFELNTLFSQVLKTLGFRVTDLAARVLWNAPTDRMSPRTHMLLRVDLADGPYIADVGFGGLTMTAPLRLEADTAQKTPHGLYRLLANGDGFRLQAQLGEDWMSLYEFDLQEQFPIDYVVANHYVSTYPNSLFLTTLFVARATPFGRYTLLGDRLSIYRADGTIQRRHLTTAAEFHDALQNLFDLPIPDTLDAALARIGLI